MRPPGVVTPVYLCYSEVFSAKRPERYWQLLRELPKTETLEVLAQVNRMLVGNTLSPAIHRELHKTFVAPEISEHLRKQQRQDGGPIIIFHRRAIVAAIRNLIIYGSDAPPSETPARDKIGELILCANDFIEHEARPFRNNLDLASFTIGAWTDYNLPHVGHCLARLKIIFDDIIKGPALETARLRSLLGSLITVDGLAADDFWAATFCTLAATAPDAAVVIDTRSVATGLPRAMPLVEQLITKRSLSIDQFARRLAGGDHSPTYDLFERDLGPKGIASSIILLRSYPLLKLDQHRVLVLDRQLLFDLLSSGTYWIIFDSLDDGDRDSFKQLWGHVFESYVIRLLEHFYQSEASTLRSRVKYHEDNEIDALLDFGDDVVVFEIKSSRLTLEAKCSADQSIFELDVRRKFVRTPTGKPKAVAQLAKASRHLASKGSNLTSRRPKRIYPVIVSDELGCQCLGFNAYLNECFRRELGNPSYVKPLTVMSIDECEQVLPHIASGDFSWRDLLKARMEGRDVSIASVSQTLYDLRLRNSLPIRENSYLSDRYDRARGEIIGPLQGDRGQEAVKNF